MISKTETFKADDQKPIFYRVWAPDTPEQTKGIVQIVHGLAEHSARYARFAEALVNAGFAVYADDHRGHGQTAGNPEQVGYFEDANFWESTLGDLQRLGELARAQYPEKPLFIFGHSMGSLLTRHLISMKGKPIQGTILSGTAGDPGALGNIGIFIANLSSMLSGRKKRSSLLTSLSFGQYNNGFKPNRTDFDWLSRDEEEVDKYVNDPYCGPKFTAGFWTDFLKGIKIINQKSTYEHTPNELPIYLIAGDKDPVGDNGKGVSATFEAYKKAGIKDVSCDLYKDARHELLNESNREEVTKTLIEWMVKRL